MLSRKGVSTVYVILDASVVQKIAPCHRDQPTVVSILAWLESRQAPGLKGYRKRLVIVTSQQLEREISSRFGIIEAKRTLFKVQWLWNRSVQVETKLASRSWIDSRLDPTLLSKVKKGCGKYLRSIGDDIKFVNLLIAILVDSNRSSDRGYILGVKDPALAKAIDCCVCVAFSSVRIELVLFDDLWNAMIDC